MASKGDMGKSPLKEKLKITTSDIIDTSPVSLAATQLSHPQL